jgi:hypothetical protein
LLACALTAGELVSGGLALTRPVRTGRDVEGHVMPAAAHRPRRELRPLLDPAGSQPGGVPHAGDDSTDNQRPGLHLAQPKASRVGRRGLEPRISTPTGGVLVRHTVSLAGLAPAAFPSREPRIPGVLPPLPRRLCTTAEPPSLPRLSDVSHSRDARGKKQFGWFPAGKIFAENFARKILNGQRKKPELFSSWP